MIFVIKQSWYCDFWTHQRSPNFNQAHPFQRHCRFCWEHKNYDINWFVIQKDIHLFADQRTFFLIPKPTFRLFRISFQIIKRKSQIDGSLRDSNPEHNHLEIVRLPFRYPMLFSAWKSDNKWKSYRYKAETVSHRENPGKWKWSQKQHSPLKHEKTPLWHNNAQQPQQSAVAGNKMKILTI